MKFNTEDIQNNKREYTTQELLAAIQTKEILQARALMLDSGKNLHVALGCMQGIIPYAECANGIESGEVREIALITRVGKSVCFTVEEIDTESFPPRAILSRTKAQRMCKELYLSTLVPGDIIPCLVTHTESFGAFCDVGCGISALAPIDCLSVSRIKAVTDRIRAGMHIKCVVKGRDEKGRLILSIKELLGTWSENAQRFNAGETVVGIVRSIESYGVFVELAPNLAGLAEERDGLEVGQLVSVYIKSILPEKMKIKLSLLGVCESGDFSFPLNYFIESGHISHWVYSPAQAHKLIEVSFE